MTLKRNPSRRDVLKGIAASAIAAPLFVSGRALGLEDKAPASERITVGHIGVGDEGPTSSGTRSRCLNSRAWRRPIVMKTNAMP